MRFVLFLVSIFAFASPLFAQHERFELGLRLRQFEREWDDAKDPAGRKRALGIVVNATNQFFSLKFGEAGKTLDSAKWALTHENPRSDAQLWVASLMMKPEKRIFETATKSMKVTIDHFYKVKGTAPAGATARLRIGVGEPVNVSLEKLPVTVEVAFPELRHAIADLHLTGEIDGKRVLFTSTDVARLQDPEARVKKLKELVTTGKLIPSVAATVNDRVEMFTELLGGAAPETDFPYDTMLDHAEMVAGMNAMDRFPDSHRGHVGEGPGPGRLEQFWYTFALEKKQLAPVRIGNPNHVDAKKPVPVVFALHGAGGSENMFFDSYGAGAVVKECEKRGWLLIATRSPGFVQSPAVKEVLDQVEKMRAIDRSKVFILGHSMGAGQTIDLCQKYPNFFAGAAVMGGGGRLRDAKAFDTLPTFIGIGDKDFALAGAKSLNQGLVKSGAKRVTFKEYSDVEHLVIVREALPDVFKMFDEVVKK